LTSCNFVKCIIEQNRAKSSSLDRSTLEDSIKIYLIFFTCIQFTVIFRSSNEFLHFKIGKKKISKRKIDEQFCASFGPRPRNRGTVHGRFRPTRPMPVAHDTPVRRAVTALRTGAMAWLLAWGTTTRWGTMVVASTREARPPRRARWLTVDSPERGGSMARQQW
jgi:hypothetical protein